MSGSTVRLVIPDPARNPHASAFDEVIIALVGALGRLGLRVELHKTCPPGPGAVIVLAPHLQPVEALARLSRAETILYTWEPLGETHARLMTTELLQLMRDFVIWDYSARNVWAWRNLGARRVLHVPVAYDPALERLGPSLEPEVDVLFYGSLHPRRAAVLEELQRRGLRVKFLFGVYGAERDAWIRRSRLVLNMHSSAGYSLELARLTYLWANRIPVICELNGDTEDHFGMGGVALCAPYEELPDAVIAALDNPGAVAVATARSYEWVRSQADAREVLRQALLQTASFEEVPDPFFGRVAVAMIVRDEERNIGRAMGSLASLSDLLGEVCVYDTGSTDDTPLIAAAAGARVERGRWVDDFSWARNQSLEMVGQGWALVLDADEQVRCDPSALATLLQEAEAEDLDALHVLQVNADRNGASDMDAWQTRLVRVDRCRFRGALHEQVGTTQDREPRFGVAPAHVLRLIHDGYADPQVLSLKSDRNARIVDGFLGSVDPASAEPREIDEYYRQLLHRARALLITPRSEEAVADLWRVHGECPAGRVRAAAVETLVEVYLDRGDDRFEELLNEMERIGENPDLAAWVRAVHACRRGDMGDAYSAVCRIVDPPLTLMSGALPLSQYYSARAMIAENVGVESEALSWYIVAVATGDASRQHIDALLSLWGERPMAILAELLADACQEARTTEDVMRLLAVIPTVPPELLDKLNCMGVRA